MNDVDRSRRIFPGAVSEDTCRLVHTQVEGEEVLEMTSSY